MIPTSREARQLSALKTADPDRWFATVRAALERHKSIPDAAKSLGLAARTVFRWAEEVPALKAEIELRQPGRLTTKSDRDMNVIVS